MKTIKLIVIIMLVLIVLSILSISPIDRELALFRAEEFLGMLGFGWIAAIFLGSAVFALLAFLMFIKDHTGWDSVLCFLAAFLAAMDCWYFHILGIPHLFWMIVVYTAIIAFCGVLMVRRKHLIELKPHG
jgi:hypothetical protein